MQWLMLLAGLGGVPLRPVINPLLSPSTLWVLIDCLRAFSPLATNLSSIHHTDLLQLFLTLRLFGTIPKELPWSTKVEGFYFPQDTHYSF